MFLDITVSGFETDIGQIERYFLVFAELSFYGQMFYHAK